MAEFQPDLLVSPEWLLDHLTTGNLVVVDCPWDGAWYQAGNGGAYSRAHIPGAVCQIRHPYIKADNGGEPSVHLPPPHDVVALAEQLGIGPDTTVVLYDDWGSIFAARLWWVLRYYGHTGVRLLDGGWQAWVEEGGPIEIRPTDAVVALPLEPKPDEDRIATLDQVLERHDNDSWQVIDARSDDEWTGKDLQGNKRGGHVPGALHLEWSKLLTNSSDFYGVRRFRSPEEIQALFDTVGIDRSKRQIPHCQSAVRGAFMGFALELMGHEPAAVYDGSFAEYASRDDAPIEA